MLAVATMTWARSAHEELTLRRSLQRLAHTGLRVSVADVGNNPGFADFLGALPAFTVMVPDGAGLVAQVKASIEMAARFGTPYILYTEPDKESFFSGALTDFIERAGDEWHVSVVLASRDERSLRTFPPMQRYTEGVVNHLCAEFLGCSGDYCYGPFLMDRGLLPVIADLPPDLGWGWRPFVFRAARHRGLRVSHVTGDYPCPPDQRTEDEDERRHRMRQLTQNVLGLIAPIEPRERVPDFG